MPVEVEVSRRTRSGCGLVLTVLGDPELLVSLLGGRGVDVRLVFRRLLSRFEDVYRVEPLRGGGGCVSHLLSGRRSRLILSFCGSESGGGCVVTGRGEYWGPRGGVVASSLRGLLSTVIRAADEVASRVAPGGTVVDLSPLLASLTWVSRVLYRSVQLRDEVRVVPRGGVQVLVEEVAASGAPRRFELVYATGTGDEGFFRVLFLRGEVRGVYAVLRGEEFIGDARVLNEFEGVLRFKVYGSLMKLEEVLSPAQWE